MTKVTVEDIAERLESGNSVKLIDSRSADAWNAAKTKAKGAIRIAPDQIVGPDLPHDEYLAIYCT